jgi:hypothetical protein
MERAIENDRIQTAVSSDGTRISASVRGEGPSVQHVARHVSDATVREIAGAAHFGPWTHPRAVAHELIRFFTEVGATAGPLTSSPGGRSTHGA